MRDQLVELTSQLISFPTVTADITENSRIISFISDWSRAAGLQVSHFDHNSHPSLLISLSDQNPRIILNGHADVVPANSDQFSARIQGDQLFGRGSQDMKSGLAAMLLLMRDFKSAGNSYPLSLMVVTDEEIGGFDGTKRLLADLKLRPDFFIAGESTDLKIEYQAKGIIWAKLKTKGQRAHGAYPWEGKNAIRKIIADLDGIYQVYPEPEGFLWATTCNVGKITGGLAANQVPGEAEAILDIRRVPTESSQSVIDVLKKSLVSSDSQLEILLDEPAHSVPQDHPAVLHLAQVISRHMSAPAGFIQKSGASDARHFSAANIPSVCFGPMGSGLHTDSEYLAIPSLVTYFEILQDFVIEHFS